MSGVEVRGVNKRFGASPVLEGIDATFVEGRFTSLLGPSGSGKTTLLRIIGGFSRPDAGRIVIGGADVTAVPLWKRQIGMVFQSYALFPHMTVAQNVAYGLNRRGIRGAAAAAEVARALELVHLTGFDTRAPKQLSGGQQQRVALARAIVTKPRVLLLDEPLSALDRRLRQSMQIELKRIQRESGLTTIFVTHDQEEALTLSDWVAILDKGRLVQEGTPDGIYEHPRTAFAAAFLGDANIFEGIVRDDGIETPVGPLRTSDPLPAAGMGAKVAVRPERMAVLPLDSVPDGNSIEATVRTVIYAGAVSTCLLTSADGRAIKVLVPNHDAVRPEPGNRMRVAWAPTNTVLLVDENESDAR